jgi:hypothetical protein
MIAMMMAVDLRRPRIPFRISQLCTTQMVLSQQELKWRNMLIWFLNL